MGGVSPELDNISTVREAVATVSKHHPAVRYVSDLAFNEGTAE